MGKEDQELITFFDWVRINENLDPRFKAIFHVANERKTSFYSGKILKAKGVRAGIPDVCVPIPRGMHAGLWIEFKVKPNKVTDSQKYFMEVLFRLGYKVCIAWSADEAISIVREYLDEPVKMAH